MTDRELRMRDWFLAGMTLQEIGDMQTPKISRERVRQLLKKHFGLSGRDGGQFLRVTPVKIHMAIEIEKKRKERITTRYARYFGCTLDEFLHINETYWNRGRASVKNTKEPAWAYYHAALNATKVSVEWNITFPDWWKIWQESGHWRQRGRGAGYCMARIGNSGAFEMGNVEIKTNGANFSDSYFAHPASDRVKKRKPYAKGTKTHCRNSHERTPENTVRRGGKPCCRLCDNQYQRERYARIKAAHDE